MEPGPDAAADAGTGATTGATSDAGVDATTDAGVDVTCPRCGRPARLRFYGPCDRCRMELRAAFAREGRVVEVADYEPKMNVTPNAVALRDD